MRWRGAGGLHGSRPAPCDHLPKARPTAHLSHSIAGAKPACPPAADPVLQLLHRSGAPYTAKEVVSSLLASLGNEHTRCQELLDRWVMETVAD